MSRKLSFLPQPHSRCDFEQLLQVGLFSSHFRCLSLHVKHPVRVRLGLLSDMASLSFFLEDVGLFVGDECLDGGVSVFAMLSLG